MQTPHIKGPRRTSAVIKKLLEDFTRSGISAKEFCLLHNISQAGFYKWRTRYAKRSRARKNNFVQLKQFSVPMSQPALFAEVKDIKIYQAVTACYLKELLA